MQSLREESGTGDEKFLAVAGPYEFERIQKIRHPDAHYARLARAFARLDYDLGMLCSVEAQTLRSLDIPYPSNWFPVENHPLIKTIRLQDRASIGFILLPVPEEDAVWSETQNRAVRAVEKNKGRVDLLFGISPWGKTREQEFLERHPGTFDILLGGGPGGGVRQRFSEDRKTLWVRPYRKGKTVSKITLPDQEQLRPESGWRPEENVKVETIALSEEIHADQEITAIFRQ
ncbi:MAG: hypothetical protein K9K79_02955 [Desulfohalobiaceae bacterium]|nr:hypothetical protein [Desulfohalobiaceae bacterium]